MKAGTERGIRIRIAQSKPSKYQPDQDTLDLVKAGFFYIDSFITYQPNALFIDFNIYQSIINMNSYLPFILVCLIDHVHFRLK